MIDPRPSTFWGRPRESSVTRGSEADSTRDATHGMQCPWQKTSCDIVISPYNKHL